MILSIILSIIINLSNLSISIRLVIEACNSGDDSKTSEQNNLKVCAYFFGRWVHVFFHIGTKKFSQQTS